MAGIAVPDNLRPAVEAVAKHHFWILAALVPLVLVPTLFVGTGSLRGRITAAQRQIEAKLGQSRAVTALQPHPNESWRAAIDSDLESVDRETRDEWRRFWHGQARLRTWPTDLGKEFLDDVTALRPGGKLDRSSLVRYQNMAPRLARSLPQQMGVEDLMAPGAAPGGTLVDLTRPGATPALAPKLSWNQASQRRVYDSFVWERVPNTTQVLLAQEELWVYGLFCRQLAGFVKDATGGHDSPLVSVDELIVGFPAIADPDSGRQGARILMPKAADGAPAVMPGMDMPPGAEGPAQTPWHPRFSAGGGGQRPVAPGAGDQPAGSSEDDYRGWIYVDLDGKPLSVAELATKPGMQMVHLMPFVLRVTIDQRHLDRLLLSLAASPVPIDVRQVRVNPGTAVGLGSGEAPSMTRGGPGGGLPGMTGISRANDLFVELRGSVALATNPAAAPAAPAGPGTVP